MTLLQRYLSSSFITTLGLVLFVLLALHSFIALVAEIRGIGTGDYHLINAFQFVLFGLPRQLYEFFPVVSLLAGLLSLGGLATHSELIAMRAAGVSIMQITCMMLKTILVLLILVTLLGESVALQLAHQGSENKSLQRSGGQALKTADGVWLRQGHWFISIRQISRDAQLENVTLYRFDENQQLREAIYAKQAVMIHHQWQLMDVEKTNLSSQGITVEHQPRLILDLTLNPQWLKVMRIQPKEMSLPDLYRYIVETRHSGSQARSYEFVFWQRILQPIATGVMVLLAIPFIFGPLRSTTAGVRLMVGVIVGFSFYLMNQFFGPVSVVYQWPPLFAALLPILLFGSLGYYLLRRIN